MTANATPITGIPGSTSFATPARSRAGSYGAVMWGARRLSHLALKQGEKTAAMAQAAILKPRALPWGVAYVKFGPVWKCTGHPESRDTLRAILTAIVQEYASGAACTLS